MQVLRPTRATTSVAAATVVGLYLLGLAACGSKGSDETAGGVASLGPPAVAGEAEGGRDRTAAASGLKIGDEAPLFSLVGSDGRTYNLADYRGRQAIVLAWFAKAFNEA
jgi:hypothetical protein